MKIHDQGLSPLLMCKIWCQTLNFGGEFFTVGGQKKIIFLSASRSQFVAIGPTTIVENRCMDNIFMAKMNFE